MYNTVIAISLGAAGVAVIYGLVLAQAIMKKPAGNKKMVDIAKAIQDGAKAYLWNIQAGYTFGNFMIKAMYGSNTQKDIYDDVTTGSVTMDGTKYTACAGCREDFNYKSWSFGVDYNMSKRTKAFLLYTANDSDELDLYNPKTGLYSPETQGIDWNGFQLGMMHNF